MRKTERLRGRCKERLSTQVSNTTEVGPRCPSMSQHCVLVTIYSHWSTLYYSGALVLGLRWTGRSPLSG